MNGTNTEEAPLRNPSESIEPSDPETTFEEVDSDQIPETDIQFECPYCGKSLSIDQRGAGLVIECTQCHQLVTVPIPEGMKLSDLDLPPEEKETQLANMRVMLAKSQDRIASLVAENQDLREKADAFDRWQTDRAKHQGDLQASFEELRDRQTALGEALERLRLRLTEL
jgi:hypothetical protein